MDRGAELRQTRAESGISAPRFGGRRISFPDLVTVLLGAGVAVVLIVALIRNRNFWQDEATLFLAIAEQTDLRPGVPLALYEASAPYGVVLLYKAIINVAGLNETVLRIPAILAFAGGLYILVLAARSLAGKTGGIVTLIIAGYSYIALQYATSFKQWSFEFLATCVLLGLAQAYRRTGSRAWLAGFVAGSVVLNLFANTAVFAAAAVLVALAVEQLRKGGGFASLVKLFVAGAIVVLAAAANYLLLVRPANAFQLDLPIYEYSLVNVAKSALVVLHPSMPKVLAYAASALWLLLAAVAVVLAVRRRTSRLVFVSVVAAVVGLELAAVTLLELVPIMFERHLLFAVPVVALAAAVAVAELVPALRSRVNGRLERWGWAAMSAFAVFLTVAAGASASTPIEEVGTVLASPSAANCQSILPYYRTFPNVELYAERAGVADKVVAGSLSGRSGSGADSWDLRASRDLEEQARIAAESVTEPGTVCVIRGRPAGNHVGVLLEAVESRFGGTCEAVERDVNAILYRCGEYRP